MGERIDNVPANVPVNVPVNQRQQWFIHQLQKTVMVSAKDIAAHWKVSEKTAKRDITDLKQKKIVAFSGPAKSGYYYLLNAESNDR